MIAHVTAVMLGFHNPVVDLVMTSVMDTITRLRMPMMRLEFSH
jgi:hypothetical protein